MKTLPTWIEIDLDALIDNIRAIQSKVSDSVRIMLMVKADAYGHGAVEIASAAESHVDGFAVATTDEAIELSSAGIAKKILIISPILAEEVPAVVDRGFVTTAATLESATQISDYAMVKGSIAELHIEVDTGMGRAGVLPSEIDELLARIATLGGVKIAGMFTHFPVAEADRQFTRDQIAQFGDIAKRVNAAGIVIPTLHCANSAAIACIKESHFDMVRPGLIAYGHDPVPGGSGLSVRPVMHWKCRIIQLREVPTGTTISYGRTFTAQRPTWVAVLPVGYGHGYPLRLSNCGEVIVSGTRAPILGRVTMDMTMVDVTDVKPQARVGDEVVLLGAEDGLAVNVDEIAHWVGTISYEVLTRISKRVPRTYFRDGKLKSTKSLLGVTSTK